jgi:hypothetical protein
VAQDGDGVIYTLSGRKCLSLSLGMVIHLTRLFIVTAPFSYSPTPIFQSLGRTELQVATIIGYGLNIPSADSA